MVRYGRLQPERREFTKKEKAEHRRLKKAFEESEQTLNAYYDNEDEPEDDARREQLEEAAAQAEHAVDEFEARLEAWSDEQKARAGAFVILNHLGVPAIERGLVRPQEKGAVKRDAVAGAEEIEVREKVKPLHSETLCNRLTAHRTAAVQAELLKRPTVALALLMHKLIPEVFSDQYQPWGRQAAVEIRGTSSHSKMLRLADDMELSPAWQAIDAERQKWASTLPRRYRDLLPWLLSQPDDVMASLFAFCVAATVDGVSASDSEHPINTIGDVLDLDMRQYWKPTRESYLNHVSKQRIIDVVAQAISPEAAAPLAAMKKAEAAEAAEMRLADSGWLPEVLTNRAAPEPLDDEEDDGNDAEQAVEGSGGEA
jgi:ParB family chromosome partitioning protein